MKISDKKQCCGCSACVSICPEKCLVMREDHEGFFYPVLDQKRCTECGRCYRVCPILKNTLLPKDRCMSPKVYAAWNNNNAIRLESSSGGLFSALAVEMFEQHGFVAGAVFNEDHTVSHLLTQDIRRLEDIRRSKYIQSRIDNLYQNIQHRLERGTRVLMCGAPCQVRGLYAFLEKDNSNLITCDFICHGVNSPKVFLKYLNDLEFKYESKVEFVNFRNKNSGWKSYSTQIIFENGSVYAEKHSQDFFMRGFLERAFFMRPCCYDCRFREWPRQADITLADFWGIENIAPECDDDQGTSLVLLNSQKGTTFFNTVCNTVRFRESDLDNAASKNPSLIKSPEFPTERDQFFADLETMDFAKLSKKYLTTPKPLSFLQRRRKYIKKKIQKIIFSLRKVV